MPVSEITEIIGKIKSGTATQENKLAALDSLQQMPVPSTLDLLIRLFDDEDPVVKNNFNEAIKKISEEDIANYLLIEDVTSEKLDAIARIFLNKQSILEAIILNPTTSDGTIKFLAANCESGQLELILLDRSRLSRTPSIIDEVLNNPRITSKIKMKIEAQKSQELGQSPIYEDVKLEIAPPRLMLTGHVEDKVDAATAEVEKIEDEDTKDKSVYQMILTMGVAEKIQFALKGPREARLYLIRDMNRIVASAVLKSPRVNENEIESFAKLRNVSDEVLREISSNRAWMRKQGIVDTLAKNPKTPVPVSLKLLPRLNKFSLKFIATSRDLPEAVRRHAKMLIERQQQR